jgi:hypothetical protein
MERTAMEDRASILARYHRMREVGRRLSTEIVHTLGREDIHQAGEALGLLRNDVLVFDTEDVASILMDYAIFFLRHDGLNAVDRYLNSRPPDDPVELQWLCDRQATRYTVYQVRVASRGFGVECLDLVYNENISVIDIGFSETAGPGVTFAGSIFPMGEFWTATGASLPLSHGILRKLKPHIQRLRSAIRGGSPAAQEAEAEFAARAIRWALDDGAALRVQYR